VPPATIPNSPSAPPPQGGNLFPNWEGFKAGVASLADNTLGSLYRLATGQAGAALGDRAYRKALQRGIENPDAAVVVGLVGEDVIGAQAVEGISGYDLATSQPIPGQLLDGGERSQRLASVSAAFFGAAALGTGLVAKFTPVGPKMYPGPPSVAPKTAGLSCFPAGTPVATAAGLRPIESVVEGQLVWAYDLIASEWQLRRVLRTYSRPCEGYAATVTVAGETINSTSRHPYFVISGSNLDSRPRLEHLAKVPEGATTAGRWVDAGDLRAGDELLVLDRRLGRIEQVRLYPFFEKVSGTFVDPPSPDHVFSANWDDLFAPPGAV
jgi:hypothetical protein